MLTLSLAEAREQIKNPTTRPEFMAMFGPKMVTRIALDRETPESEPTLTFDTEHGPQFDGKVDIVGAAILTDSDSDISLLLHTQRASERLGEIKDYEQAMLGDMFHHYLKDDRDVDLSGKADGSIADTLVVAEFKSKDGGETYTALDRTKDMTDFRVAGKTALVYLEGRATIIGADQLSQNLEQGVHLGTGAIKVVPLGKDAKLARAPKIGGQKILAFAYNVTEGDGVKLVVIDAADGKELNVMNVGKFDGIDAFATGSHDGDEICLVTRTVIGADIANEIADAADAETTGDKPTEKFELRRIPAATFFADESPQV